MVRRRTPNSVRTGTVAVELAVLLPLLMFLCVIGIDYARVFSRTIILETASRNACFYACQDPVRATNNAAIVAVAMKDLTDISPTPTVTSKVYSGPDGTQYVVVTVEQTFVTVTKYPGVPSESKLTRFTEMRVCPTAPKPGTYANY